MTALANGGKANTLHAHVLPWVDEPLPMRNLLGGKGFGLAEMSRLGIPVPPGFTTEEWQERYSAALVGLRPLTRLAFGDVRVDGTGQGSEIVGSPAKLNGP